MYKLQKKLDAEKQKSFSVNDGNMDSGVGKPLWGPSYRTVDYTVYSLTGSGESNREYQTWSGLQTSDGKYNLRDRINSPLSDEWKKKIDELLHLVDAVDEMETGGLGLVHTEQDKVYMPMVLASTESRHEDVKQNIDYTRFRPKKSERKIGPLCQTPPLCEKNTQPWRNIDKNWSHGQRPDVDYWQFLINKSGFGF